MDTNQQNDVFVYDRADGHTEIVSLSSGGSQGDGASVRPSCSSDGRFIAFESDANNLAAGDSGSIRDVFLRDRQLGTTLCASVTPGGVTGNGPSSVPCMSGDGRVVAFASEATNLLVGDTNGFADIFAFDTVSGTLELVSQSTLGVHGDGHSGSVGRSPSWVSNDGNLVVFASSASTLVPNDNNHATDVFLRDRATGITSRLSLNSLGVESNGGTDPNLSPDGRFVVFVAGALLPEDVNGFGDVYVLDRNTGLLDLVSDATSGTQGNASALGCNVSADGRFVAFGSSATNLVPGDTNGFIDVFLHDRVAGTTIRVSTSTLGAEGDEHAADPDIDDAGSTVVFWGRETSLVPGDSNGAHDVFLVDTGTPIPVSVYCPAKKNSKNCFPRITSSGLPRLSGYDSFFISATQVLNNKSGMLVWGSTAATLPFHGGWLCVQPPLVRAQVAGSGGTSGAANCSGAQSFHFGQSYMTAHAVTAGQTVYAQFWSRDPGFPPPDDIGLTDAIQFTVAP
ncbi:MAG: hypothetical protein K8S98_18750 [Planctomycetes bacterium]|nr:hypothetical protein [Planctomycetota bacterium]